MKKQIWDGINQCSDYTDTDTNNQHHLKKEFVNVSLKPADKIIFLNEPLSIFTVKDTINDFVNAYDENQALRTFFIDTVLNIEVAKKMAQTLGIKVIDKNSKTKIQNKDSVLDEGEYYIAQFRVPKNRDESGFYLINQYGKKDGNRYKNLPSLKDHFKIERVSKRNIDLKEFQKANEYIKRVWKFIVSK